MKKILTVLFIFLFASTALALMVGDKMPYIKGAPDYVKPWLGYLTGVSGEQHFKDNKVGEGFKMEAYLTCDNVSLLVPFGVYDSVENLVYLDPDMDGIIDSVISPNQSIASTAPLCP